MKHYSPSSTEYVAEPRLGEHLTDAELVQELQERIRRRNLGADLLTEEQVIDELARRLDGRNGEHGRLAADLGIAQSSLSSVLGRRYGVSDELARRIGFRKVIRFERIG